MVWLYPVCRTNPDFLHNPAVVQQSTETVHRICEGNSSHWTAWDVTVMAREWAAGSLDNNGVILWATNEAVNGRDIRFAAREAANATIRPVLRVAYGAGIDPGADCSMFDDWSNVCPADTQPPTTSEPTPSPTPGPTPSTTAAPTTSPTPSEPTPSPTPPTSPIITTTSAPSENITSYGTTQDALLEGNQNRGSADYLIVAKHTSYPLSKEHGDVVMKRT